MSVSKLSELVEVILIGHAGELHYRTHMDPAQLKLLISRQSIIYGYHEARPGLRVYKQVEVLTL